MASAMPKNEQKLDSELPQAPNDSQPWQLRELLLSAKG